MTVTIDGTTGVQVTTGNVGVGTSSPAYQIETTSSAKFGTYVGINANPSNITRLYISQGADYTLGTNYALFIAGSGYSGGIALDATSMQIGQNSASRALTFHSGTSFAERMRLDTSGNLQVGGTTVANTAGYVNSRTNARAWVNFNGTSASPITPRANYNVSSVTKNATGDYTLNFTIALADANYSCVVSASLSSTNSFVISNINSNSSAAIVAPTTSAIRFITLQYNGSTYLDASYINATIFGN